MVALRQPTKRLGELLLARGAITPAQLDHALQSQRSSGELLGAVFLRLGLVQPETLLEVLSEQFGIPHERLSPALVDWELVDQFPPSVLSASNGFPIRADTDSVTVAIANPLDAWALGPFEQARRFRIVKPVLVLEEALRAVHQAYRERTVRRIATQLNDHGTHETH